VTGFFNNGQPATTYEDLDKIAPDPLPNPTRPMTLEPLQNHVSWYNRTLHVDPTKFTCLRCVVYVTIAEDQRVCWCCGKSDRLSRTMAHIAQTFIDGARMKDLFCPDPNPPDAEVELAGLVREVADVNV